MPYGSNVLAFEAAMGVLDGSLKLTMPRDCPPKLVSLIERCFARNPEERPTFQGVYDGLAQL